MVKLVEGLSFPGEFSFPLSLSAVLQDEYQRRWLHLMNLSVEEMEGLAINFAV